MADELLAPADNPYLLSNINAGRDAQFKATTTLALEANPDQVAKTRQQAAYLGVPPAAAEALPEETARRAAQKQIDEHTADAPALRMRYTDDSFAKVAHDDSFSLSQIEKGLRVFLDGGALKNVDVVGKTVGLSRDVAAGAVGGLGALVGGVGEMIDIGARAIDAPIRRFAGDRVADAFWIDLGPTVNAALNPTLGLKTAGRGYAELEKAIGTGDKTFATDVAKGIGQLVQQVTTALMTGGTSEASMLVPLLAQGVDSMTKRTAKDDAPQANKDSAALLGGLATALTEKWGIDQLINRVPPKIKNDILRFVADKGVAFASEFSQELAENLLQDVTRKLLTNPDAKVGDSGLYEGTVGGTAAAIVRTMLGIRLRGQQADSDATAASLGEMFALATGNKLRERDPESFAAFVQAAADENTTDDKPGEVFVDGAVLAQSMEAAGITPEQFAQLAPLAAEQLAQVAPGGDVAIPVGELVGKLTGTGLETSLLQHLRASPEALSQAEAQEASGKAQEFLQQQAESVLADAQQGEAARAAGEVVRTEVLDQLTTANRFTKDVNEAYAKLVEAFYVVTGHRMGLSAEQLYNEYPLQIGAERVKGDSIAQEAKAARYQKALLGERKLEDLSPDERAQYDALGAEFAQAGELTPVSGEVGYRATGMPAGGYYAVDAAGSTLVKKDYKYGDMPPRFKTPEAALKAGPKMFTRPLAQGPETAARPRGTYNPQAIAISLLQNADLSTFLHESAHFFLDVLGDIASQPNAPADVQADMGALLKWFGVADLASWRAMTLDQQRPHHERFAQSFEAYLFEGKAPNTEMSSLFGRFRAWLTNVYRSLAEFVATRPELQLSDEVRSVMDRLIATDEQIAQAEAARGYAPDPDATGQATEQLQRRSLRDMRWLTGARSKALRELQKDATEKRKAVEAEVRAEVEAEPVYQAQAFIDDARAPTAADKDAVKEWKDRRAAHEEQVTEKVKAALLATPEAQGLKGLEKGQYLARNKKASANVVQRQMIGWETQNPKPQRVLPPIEADVIGERFGFASGDEMLRALADAQPIKQVIEGMTDQRMLERYGDLATQDGLQRAADEAVHNDARAKALATELSGLNAKLGKPSVITAAAKDFAKRVLAGRKVRDLKPWQHAAAETRAGKRMREALAKADSTAAAAALRDQILHHHLEREARAILAEVGKAEDFFRTIVGGAKDVVSKSRDFDVVQAARAVLAEYGIGTKGEAAQKYLEVVAKNDPGMHAVLADQVAQMSANAKPLKDLTVDELRGLKAGLEQMWYLAKRSRLIEIDGQLVDIGEAKDALVARLEAIGIPDRVPGEGHAVTEGERLRAKIRSVGAALRRVENWALSKDGNTPGPFTKYVWQPVREAANRFRADKAKYLKRYRALLEKVDVGVERIAAPELGYTFGHSRGGSGKAEILHALLHTGNESNQRKLLLGRGWATERADGTVDTARWDAFVARMIAEGKLTKDDFDFAQGVWDLLEEMKPLAQKTHRDVFGRYFDEVTADPFTNQFGTYRGGYVPAIMDSEIVKDAATRALQEDENQTLAYAFPSTNKGFTKARVENNKPLLLDLRSLSSHIDKVLLFSHMEQPVREVRKVLASRGVSTPLHRVDSVAFDSILTPWLNRAARQTVEAKVAGDNGLMRFFSAARSRAGMAAMFANVSNTAQQFTGVLIAASKVPPGQLLSAMADYVKSPKTFTHAVAESSIYMATRMENEVAQMSGAIDDILLNPSVYEKAQAWTSKHAYFLQSAVDNVIGPIVWTGAYNQALEDGSSELDAVRAGDAAVRMTQGSTLPEDVSRIETGNAFVRMFTQFTGYFNMIANLGGDVAAEAHALGLRKGMGRGLYVFLLAFYAPAMVSEAIVQAFRGGPDDEDRDGTLDDWLMAVLFMGPMRTALAMVPGVGAAANAGINAFNKKPYDDRISTSPAVSMIESMVAAPHSVYKAVVDGGNARKAVRDLATLVSMTTGLPAAALARPLGYLAGVETGKIDPTSAADAVRGAVTGTASPDSKN